MYAITNDGKTEYVDKETAKTTLLPFLKLWNNIVSKHTTDVKYNGTVGEKELEKILDGTNRKCPLDESQLAGAYYPYEEKELTVECSLSYNTGGEIKHFVFFRPEKKCVSNERYNFIAFGIYTVSNGTVCDNVVSANFAENADSRTLQDIFDELGLTEESKPLMNFIAEKSMEE